MPIVREILQHAVTDSSLSHLLAASDSDGCNLYHYLSRLTTKIDVEESDTFTTTLLSVHILQLLRSLPHTSDVILINSRDTFGNTPLHLACEVVKEVAFIRLLLEDGADASAFNDVSGLTSLHIAVKKRTIEVVRCLLDFDADPLATSLSPSITQPSAYDVAVSQLKDNHPIVLLLATAIEERKNKVTAPPPQSHPQPIIEGGVPNHPTIPTIDKSSSTKINDDDDDDGLTLNVTTGEDEVEEFTPLEDSVHHLDLTPNPNPNNNSVDEEMKDAVAMTSLLFESFLSDNTDSPMKAMASERALTTTTLEDEEENEEEEDLSLRLTSLPHSPPPPLTITDTEEEDDVRSTPAVSPIQAYLNLNIADITPSPSYQQKKRKKKDKTPSTTTIVKVDSEVEEGSVVEEDFEDFIESLLGGGVPGSVKGVGETIVQVAEQKHVTSSSKKRSPRKPKPPPQNTSSTSTTSFQGRRRSTLKTVTSPPHSNTTSTTPSTTATAVNVYVNLIAPVPVSPRSKKESDSPKPRPSRPVPRGSVVIPAKKGNTHTLTPKPPDQPKPKPSVCDVTATPALVSLIGEKGKEGRGGGYSNLADKIKSLTMALTPFDKNDTSDVADESIELDRLFVGTRPAMPTDPDDERTIRIKR